MYQSREALGKVGKSLTKHLLSECDMADSEIPVSLYSHGMTAYSGNNIWHDAGLEILNLF